LLKAKHLYVNARDAQEALLGKLVPTWKQGDVLVVERPSAEKNRLVAWIMGPLVHGGSYYKVPVLVRSVSGAFAANDGITLHHFPNVEGAEKAEAVAPLPAAPPRTTPPPLPASIAAPRAAVPLAPMAEHAETVPHLSESDAMTRIHALEEAVSQFTAVFEKLAGEIDRLSEDLHQVQSVIARLAIEAAREDA
jgi:hypothetical protein